LLNVPLRLLPVPEAPPDRSAASVGLPHLYVVPAGIVPVGLYVNGTVLHVVVACELIVAAGFTTTLTVNAAPVQMPELGVTLYTAVAAFAVVLVSVPVRVALPAAPEAPPVMFAPAGVLHAYVVPVGIVPVGVYVKPTVVQLVVLCAVTIAAGLTVTVTVKAVPVQLPELGVTL